ncbi:MAG TPA: BTAD domain-containing putative transcriptional regulator [Micromonosporaceae bacterium]|nr:BTAD domain-containing putative transcriptional regulator [Micromonosporaceae bacterium]
MEFRVLGSFEVIAEDRRATPSAPKLRQALALMVLEHNKIVHTHSLIDELWGESPPRQATKTVHTYIYEIRRGLQRFGDLDQILVTRPSGYMVLAEPASIDVNVCETLIRNAGEALARRDPGTARQLLCEALTLWRGQPLSNVTCGKHLQAVATRLEETWLQALEMRIDADFQLNRHHELVGELKALSESNRFHEGLHGKLMLALYRCGRRNEALEVYRRLHQRLGEELGLGPGSQIQRLQQLMLFADPALEPPPVRRNALAAAPVAPPAQLPPDIPDFVGRQDVLGTARTMLDADRNGNGAPIISLTGMPGVGKTATAVHIAHSARDHFPDGQLYADLGGSHGVPDSPAQVLGLFLRSAGLGADLPDSGNELTAAFRTWTSGRRVLLVLDDADCATQVETLLPAGHGCAVIVTSRGPLYGLSSVTPFHLAVLDVDDGAELLARIVGRDRVDREPVAAADIVRLVGGLPLAIRFLGQRLASVPTQRLDQFVSRMTKAGSRYRLSDLAYVGMDLRTRLEASYRKLDERDRSAFRLLAVLREDGFTAADASEVFLGDVVAAELTLLRLADVNLVQIVGEDPVNGRRYGLHELVRPYTLECIATGLAPVGAAVPAR